VRRREFITLLGGAAAWPVAARAQQGDRMRRVGVLMTTAADDPEAQARVTHFVKGLQEGGWTDGRNVQLEHAGTGRLATWKNVAGRSRVGDCSARWGAPRNSRTWFPGRQNETCAIRRGGACRPV
jgi:hypothetical protein